MDDQPRSNSISPLARVSLPGQHRTGFRGGPWEPTERRQRHDLQGAAPPAPAGTGGNTTHTQPALAPPPSDAPAEFAWPTTARWTKGPDGRLSLEWTLERLSHHSINRKRGSDARLRRRSKS